jgi:phenylacetate-CoA ligase
MTESTPTPKTIDQIAKQLLPDSELQPRSADDVLKLTSFSDVLRESEKQSQLKYAAQGRELQQALELRRLRQLTNIALLNSSWRARLKEAGVKKAPASYEEWQQIPPCDKNSIHDFFTGSRPGMVVPLKHGGFEIVASGGTSSGTPSETAYSLRELRDTYRIAGDFIGSYMLKRYLDGDAPKWLITTLADYQMWSSGTMVGGVLQRVPGVNYIGAGPVSAQVFRLMMSTNKGPKAIMGVTQSIAQLAYLGAGLSEEAKSDFRVAMYGSGVLLQRTQEELKKVYPNLSILSYFAATQAEAIGLQLDHEYPYLASVPGLHLVEIVDDAGQWVKEGEEGELVVTRLHAAEAPVLRFKTGDRMIRRPNIDRDDLKTIQLEFAGRSNDVIHICDTQYPAKAVYENICKEFEQTQLLDLTEIAHEIQFVNNRKANHLSLLIAVDNPEEATATLQRQFGYDSGSVLFAKALNLSLPLFSKAEANSETLSASGYHLSIRFICKMSPEIYRTEFCKVPLLRDAL